MRTISPKRGSRTSPATLLYIVAAVVLFVGVMLFRDPLGGLMWRVLSPVVALREALGSSEVAALKAELASTTAAMANYHALAAQNEALKLELGRTAGQRLIAAGVIAHPPGSPYDTLMIDAGSSEGVVLGALVRAGSVVVGSVDTVNPHSARVALISSPGQSLSAQLLTQDNQTVPVTIEGQGGGSMQGQVPAATAVVIGDTVLLPGLGGDVVAKVAGISASDSESFKTIYLQLPANVFDLSVVYVILP